MPNWCFGMVSVSGKPEKVKEFCKLFVFADEANKDNSKQGKYFAKSFVQQDWASFVKDYDLGDTTGVDFSVDFAWSAWSCLIEGYPQRNKRHCITLKSACKKYGVKVEIKTEEPSLGFEEIIVADKVDVFYDSKKMPLFECVCGATQYVSSDTDLKDIECWDCEKCGVGKIKDEKEVTL